MRVDEFDFSLPEALIALRPARPRDSARLMHLAAPSAERASPAMNEHAILDLPDLLRPGDVLAVNQSRVIRAALSGRRAGRAAGPAIAVKVNLIERVDSAVWRAFARPGKRLRPGDRVAFGPDLAAEIVEKSADGTVTLRFEAAGDALDRLIEVRGAPPLPPYIADRRAPDAADDDDYQTMFATAPGSVAAPTAGLHFTPALMRALAARGVSLAPLTLHVGAGTFLPVKAADTDDHVMHQEHYFVPETSAAAIASARIEGRRVIAVGTTALRTLESAAIAGGGAVRAGAGVTRLFILPGFRFQAVDLLLTNFHLPRSSLFMLVCAFGGIAALKSAYAQAIERGYRFYSYGDAMLIARVAVQS